MADTFNLPSHEIYPEGAELKQAITRAALEGYAFASNAVSELACQRLETEVAGLNLELGDHVTHPINKGTSREIHQLHERAYLPIGDEQIPVATMITRSLAARIKELRFRYPPLRDWMATEAGYQLYRDSDHHISPHRDRRNDQLLAATITITGSALVRMHEPIDDPDDYKNLRQIDEFRTTPGSIMFLRAQGLGSGEQAIHEVLPPDVGSRLILNLRMRPNILKSPAETPAT